MVGTIDEVGINGTVIMQGWTTNPNSRYSSFRAAGTEDDLSGLRYIISMYSIFKSEWAYTSYEYGFGMVSELVVAFIYGGLAGLMSTMLSSMGAAEEEYAQKVASLRAWMKDRGLSRRTKEKVRRRRTGSGGRRSSET